MANLIKYKQLEFMYQITVAPHFKFEISCLGYIKPIKIFNIKQKYCTRFYMCILGIQNTESPVLIRFHDYTCILVLVF